MTKKERAAYIEKLAKERQAIQEQITEISKKRQAYIQKEIKKRGIDDRSSFEYQLHDKLRKQAAEKNIYLNESVTY